MSGKTVWSKWTTKPRVEDAALFDQVFHNDVIPILSHIDANGKKGRVAQQLFL